MVGAGRAAGKAPLNCHLIFSGWSNYVNKSKAFPALCKPAIGKSCPLPGRQPPHMQLCFHSLCLASNLNQNLNISPTPIKALISEHLLHCALWAAFNAPESLPANASFFKPRPIAAFYPVFVPALSQAAMGGALPGPTRQVVSQRGPTNSAIRPPYYRSRNRTSFQASFLPSLFLIEIFSLFYRF